jgi:predicted TIM-barrel fold metal-dependent hydrolase
VCLHSSDSGYSRIYDWWNGAGDDGEYLPFEKDSFGQMLEPLSRPVMDSLSALICHGVFDRHPDLRIVSVENGADWVHDYLRRLDHTYGQMPKSFSQHPRDTFRKHVFVSPFYEDNMDDLAQSLPVERILFGSDFPHPEGLANPLDYLAEFQHFSDDGVKRVFHSNLKGLLEGARD